MERYDLNNVDCPSCASMIEDCLKKLPCVKSVVVDFANNALFIDTTDIKAVEKSLKSIDSKISIKKEKQESTKNDFLLLISLLGLFAIGIFIPKPLSYVVLGGVYLVAGIPIFLGAYNRIKKKIFFDENFLMLFATISAFFIDAYLESVAIMLFFRIGEFFERLALRRSKNSIKALIDISPEFANLKKENEILKVNPQELNIGDLVVVKAGEKIPSDGVITNGFSSLDQKVLNGESMPLSMGVGDNVLGGSINLESVLEIKITKKYTDSSISKIIDLIKNSTSKKASSERFITSFAKIYTPIVFFLSLALGIIPPLLGYGEFSEWIYRALVVLMVSCPCALVLSVPLAYFGGIGGASRNGILIKGASHLEALANVKKIGFDKTGTLTKGNFNVSKIVPLPPITQEQLLKYALCAENLSTHPIAKSIQDISKKMGIDQEHANVSHKNISGMGVECFCCGANTLVGNHALMEKYGIPYIKEDSIGTIIYVAVEKKYAGYILINDELKPDTKSSIDELRGMGIDMVILSGDNQKIVASIAKELEIDKFYGELLPQDKLAKFREFKSESMAKSAFVGDGINDTPVLIESDVGISMGELGSNLSKENSDVIIANDSLSKIPQAIKIARKTKSIMIENIAMALGVKGVFIILGILGSASMWEAVFGDVGVSLLALLNASRALRVKAH